MREILFKGFCQNDNGKQIITLNGKDYRGDWVEGFVLKLTETRWAITDYYPVNPHSGAFANKRFNTGDMIIKLYEIIPQTLCQFTGLTDKGGKRIWKNYKLKDGQGRVWLVLANKGGFILLSEKEYKDYLNNAPIVLFSGLSDMQTVGFVEQNCIVIGDIFNTRSVG